MKISYIITPFEDATYLIRCLNSMQRQIDCEYEIILSETAFGEKEHTIRQYLREHPKVRCFENAGLSKKEKLHQAIRNATGEYFVFPEVTTVTAPKAGVWIEDHAEGDLMIAGILVRKGENYHSSIDYSKTDQVYQRSWLCYRREYALEHEQLLLSGSDEDISLAVNRYLAEVGRLEQIREVCFYCEETENDAEYPVNPELWYRLADVLCTKALSQVIIRLFHHYVQRLVTELLIGTHLDEQETYYEILRYFGKGCADEPIRRRMYSTITGCMPEELYGMDAQSYISFQGCITELQTGSGRDTALRMTQGLAEQRKVLNQLNALLPGLQNSGDIIATNQQISLMNIGEQTAIAQSQIYADPFREVPELFAQGRLGFRAILKSLSEWLKYKLHIRRSRSDTLPAG